MEHSRRRFVARFALGFAIATALLAASPALAKWRSETFNLKPGWNAIYLFVDASYVEIDTLLAGYPQIEEIWRWQPDGLTRRILTNPEEPVSGPEWAVWRKSDPSNSAFDRLYPNYAYLVRVNATVADFTLSLKGEATLPRVAWRTDGVNLIGFPVASPNPPTFANFLDSSVLLASSAGIYQYAGGPLGAANPAKILNPGPSPLARGKGYWINIGKFSRYYGPIRLEVMGGDGLRYSDTTNSIQLLATNLSDEELSVSLAHENSESPPAGQAPIQGKVPLLLRSFDPETGSVNFVSVSETITATLAPGSSQAWTFSVDRSGMSGTPGVLYASRLRLRGGAGAEIYLPVEATVTSRAGLWVGEAILDEVASLVRIYERDEDGATRFDAQGEPILLRSEVTDASSASLPKTDQSLPLRLLVHVKQDGAATLLSHAFVGTLASATSSPLGIATDETLLDTETLESAARLSAAHLPLDTFEPFAGGSFQPGQTLNASIVVDYDSPNNPFVHAYHPDHDNLDARFENKLPAGYESYTVSRIIKMDIASDGSDAADPSWGATLLTGVYQETISGLHKNDIRVRGSFRLYRVSDVPTLTTP